MRKHYSDSRGAQYSQNNYCKLPAHDDIVGRLGTMKASVNSVLYFLKIYARVLDVLVMIPGSDDGCN